jgi:hypothetical protein
MKKYLITNLIILSTLAAPAGQIFGADWSTYGFEIIHTQKDSSEITTDTLKNSEEHEIKVTYTGEVKENVKGIIKKLNADFRSWQAMKVESIKFSVINDEIQIYVTPKEYRYNDIDVMENLSSGILFSYRGNLLYNFRIMVDNLFVPIKGIYFDEKSFNEKIISAINDPQTYINARDPDYLLEKLDRLYVEFERLRTYHLAGANGNKPVEKEILDEVLKIKSENPDYTWKEVYDVMKEKKAKVSGGVVKAILSIYYNEF